MGTKVHIGDQRVHSQLEVVGLGIGYKSRKAENVIVRNIAFSLTKGELAAIVGVNGVGKSTLLRTLAGVQSALSGTIILGDKPLKSYNAAARAKVLSVVLTEPVASGSLTVMELISLGRQPYTNWLGTLTAEDLAVIRRSLTLVGLEALRDKKCFELSDGQLQKVMIARALAQDTDLMLLDEPTTHLDLFHKVQVLKLLQQIAHDTSRTILFTTHEIDLAIQLCDKILILDNGQNPFGTPAELIHNHCFESLFPSDSITFDPGTGTFRVRN